MDTLKVSIKYSSTIGESLFNYSKNGLFRVIVKLIYNLVQKSKSG